MLKINIVGNGEEEEEVETMLTRNIKLLNLCDLNLCKKYINVSMIKVFI